MIDRQMLARGIMLLLAMGLATRAVAQESEDSLIHRGVMLRRHGRDADALELFRRAYENSHSARARAQVGLAEDALGDWLSADRDLTAALATEDPWIAKNRPTLDEARKTIGQHLCALQIAGAPPDASVLLDGRELTPEELAGEQRLLPGEHRIAATRAGYQPFASAVTVRAGEKLVVTVALMPQPVAPAPVAAAPAAATAPMAGASTTPALTARPVANEPRRSHRALAVGLAIGGAVVVAGAITLGVLLAPKDPAAAAQATCQSPCMVVKFR
jgi:hypothetical protein